MFYIFLGLYFPVVVGYFLVNDIRRALKSEIGHTHNTACISIQSEGLYDTYVQIEHIATQLTCLKLLTLNFCIMEN